MIPEFLNWDEIQFLANFRRLNEEQQHIIEWLMGSMDLLERLIPVEHIPLCELHEIMDAASQRGDPWMTVLAAWALVQKESAGEP